MWSRHLLLSAVKSPWRHQSPPSTSIPATGLMLLGFFPKFYFFVVIYHTVWFADRHCAQCQGDCVTVLVDTAAGLLARLCRLASPRPRPRHSVSRCQDYISVVLWKLTTIQNRTHFRQSVIMWLITKHLKAVHLSTFFCCNRSKLTKKAACHLF